APATDADGPDAAGRAPADDRLVLRRERVGRRAEADVVGAQLDRHQGRTGGVDGGKLGDTPGGLGPAPRDQVEVRPELVGDDIGKRVVLGGRVAAGADAVAQRDVDLALQAVAVGTGVDAQHL